MAKKDPHEEKENPEVEHPEVEHPGVEEPTPEESAGDAREGGEQDPLVAELADKLRESEDRYLRSAAEFENYRRRMAREREELRTIALAGLIEDLLPSLDNLKLGLVAADNHPEAKVVSEGFRMVAAQLNETLRGYGLQELSPEGEAFDPNSHDCIAHKPDPDRPENTVIETVRAGYKLRERLIRPASVIVSSGPAGEKGEGGGEESPAED